MFERMRSVVAVVIPVVAIAVIVAGLWPRSEEAADPADRARTVAANIKCPFCSGESIAEASSAVAADYRALIDRWVEEGISDEEIYRRFEERFGAGILLNTSGAGWGILLWIVPGLVLLAGLGAIVGLRRRERAASSERVEEPVP